MPTDSPIEPEGGSSPRVEFHDETHRMSDGYLEAIGAHLQKLQVAADEIAARRAHERALRPRLRWLVDHPRLLDWVYRLRLAARPVMPMRISTTTAFEGMANVSADLIRERELGLRRDA